MKRSISPPLRFVPFDVEPTSSTSVDMTDVKKVVMEGAAKDYVIENPQVMMIEAQGIYPD